MANKGNFEKVIKEKGVLVYTNQGTSMLPLIREKKDILIIKPIRHINRFDIILTKRPSGRFLLHRVMKNCNDGTYVICGDNSTKCDYRIKEDEIIGVLESIIRNGRTISFCSLTYRMYVLIWCKLFFIRKIVLSLKSKRYVL